MSPQAGRHRQRNLANQMLPVNADIPREIDVGLVPEEDLHASRLGAKGNGR